MAGTGLEPPLSNTGETSIPSESGAESGALGAQKPAFDAFADPELARLIEAWPTLPDAIKAGILAMVKAAGGEG